MRTISDDLPSANTATDRDWTETLGRKADTAVLTVGTTASIAAMVKGLLGRGQWASKAFTSPLTSGDAFSITGLVKVYEIVGVVLFYLP